MFFLIEYDRSKGKLIKFEKFANSAKERAQKSRLEIELTLNRKNISHEIVLLQSASEQSLKKTHRRYFQNASEIANSMVEAIKHP